MKAPHFALGILLWTVLPSSLEADGKQDPTVALGESAICQVCRVHEGEMSPETVVATAFHDGTAFGFCSAKCRDTFSEAPVSYLPPVFPRPAPAFVMHDLEGNEVSSEDYRGKTMLIDFWATWCPPCIVDLPNLSSLHQRYADQGLVVLSLSIDEGDSAKRKVRRTIKRRDATHPVFLDNTATPAWEPYLVRVVPTQFLVDSEGQIVAQWSGKIDLKIVEAEIVRLLEAGRESDNEPGA